jgi:hypothetical protein
MEIKVSEVCKIASVKHEYSILNWNTAIPSHLFWILKKSGKFVPLKSASIYFVHGLFNDAFSNSDHVTSKSKMTVNDKLIMK